MTRKPTYLELEKRVKELEIWVAGYKQTETKILQLGKIFDHLGTDPNKNIHIIVQQACEILEGVCSLYNRLDNKEKSLYAWSGFNYA